jgi:tetratricopeptide (TPR) repeat protein
LADAGAPFPRDTIGEDQQPWLDLLTGSARSTWAGRDEPPPHNVLGGDWFLRLEALGDGWLPTYVRGLLAHAGQNPSEARLLFERSMSERPNAWALRALALIDVQAGDTDRGAALYLRAHALSPASEALTIEAAETLLAAGRPSQALSVLRGSPPEPTRRGRIRLLEGQALAQMGETALVREMLEEGLEVADLREGEDGLHALWHTVFPDVAVPAVYDFRMRSTAPPLQ